MSTPRPDPLRLLALLRTDDIDGALAAGLMDYTPSTDLPSDADLLLRHAEQRLRSAWAARARYQARAQRLARRDAERQAKRAPPPSADTKPALPSAAAAILARAKARAAGNAS